jgi:hypothetical protein
MKKITLIGILVLNLSYLNAQVQQIQPKQGLELEYTIYPMGQVFPTTLTLDTLSTGALSISWKNSSGAGGKYIVTRAALDSGTTAFWGPPNYGQEVTLDSDQTMLVFSKKQWNELHKNGRVDFDGTMYARKEMSDNNQVLMDGKPADAIFLQSESSEARLWLLNNAALPLLLKVEKNPFGVDLQIERVKK